jgi:hypothetical protein
MVRGWDFVRGELLKGPSSAATCEMFDGSFAQYIDADGDVGAPPTQFDAGGHCAP